VNRARRKPLFQSLVATLPVLAALARFVV